jgi:hypothetical protein
MTRTLRAIFFLLVLACAARAEVAGVANTWDYSVQLSAAVQAAPAKITLTWTQDTRTSPSSYTVYRKSPGATSWGAGQRVDGSVTIFEDQTVAAGQAYEYRVVKANAGYSGYGYIQTGIAVPLVEARGTLVLIVERTHAAILATELERLRQDLIGDGWRVLRHDVSRTDSVASVKALIKADYAAAPTKVNSVLLFGRVPVPYSGRFNPDTHPDHMGAWPADVYYGDMQGQWTDRTVNYRQTLNPDAADAARLSNLPGDGKFDQSTIPGIVELAVGRVDFANLPGRLNGAGQGTFPAEAELLRRYLDKDHAFRHAALAVNRRAIVGDYFGLRGGESFAASGYRSFAPLVGADKITNLNLLPNSGRGQWISTLGKDDYLVAYGCGLGTYRAIEGLGHSGKLDEGDTVEMVGGDIRAVFTLIYGSWLGDWDTEDNFMRSILAAPTCTLTAAWSGRPHWFMHPMGLGETIGYTARLAQNNAGLYQNAINIATRQVHIALLGDPTLRLHPVAPARNVAGRSSGDATSLIWSASADPDVIGYHVYRADSARGEFVRLTAEPATETAFATATAAPEAIYMVRAVKLESTPSGSYYNASQGVFWSASQEAQPTGDRVAALSSN